MINTCSIGKRTSSMAGVSILEFEYTRKRLNMGCVDSNNNNDLSLALTAL